MALKDMLTPSLVELGSIKIGTLGEERTSRSGGKYRMPTKLDHFLVTTKFRDKRGILMEDVEVMDALRASHADTDGFVRRIPIAVLSDDIEDFLRSAWVYYAGKVCIARSDGVTLTKFYTSKKNGDKREWVKLDTPEECAWDKSDLPESEQTPAYADMEVGGVKMFKKHTVLDAVIAHEKARWGGVYRFRTTSVISGDNLYGSFIHIKQLTMGTLVGMPLELVVRPIQVAPDSKPTTVYVVHAEIRGESLFELQKRSVEIAQFQHDHGDRLRKLRLESKLILREPGDDEPEDIQSDVQQEFHPEVQTEEYSDDDKVANLRRSLRARLSEIGCTTDAENDLVVQWCIDDQEATLFAVEQSEDLLTAAQHRIWKWSEQNNITDLMEHIQRQKTLEESE